jgi:radical SAM protein
VSRSKASPTADSTMRHSEKADRGTTGKPPVAEVDFDRSPFTMAWEVTRACALKCVHCRAEAQPKRDPRELTHEEGLRLIDDIVEIGRPILIITGGDPMMRRDLFDLIAYAARDRGLRVAFSPSATALVTKERLSKARDAGITRTHISLDGATAESHDTFRQTPGSFQRTLEIMNDLRELGMSLQIGTTVSRYNVNELDRLAEIAAEHSAVMLNFFFLVPTGRGSAEDMISAEEHERVFNWMYDLSKTAPFDVRTTAAQHYRRVVIERRRQEAAEAATRGEKAAVGPGGSMHLTGAGYSFADGLGQSTMKGVNDGQGFAFVTHIGDVCPSGFLQIPAGNLRKKSFIEIYRNSPLFRDLRDYAKIKGKCGVCEYRDVCGGSRARAFAVTGDYMESDPYCVYVPPAWREMAAADTSRPKSR